MDGMTFPETYQPHPLAELFPLMEGDAYSALVEDIRAHGVRVPVVMLDGKILDGRNRWRAAHHYDPPIPVPTVDYDEASQGPPLDYVVSLNINRRQLSESQRAMVAAKIETMRQGERTDLEPSANLRKVSQGDAAEMLNVSPRSVQSAAAVQAHGAPELIAEVEAGHVSVSAAAEVASLPEAEQAAVVAGGKTAVRAKAKQIREGKAKKPKPAKPSLLLDPDRDRPAQDKAREIVQAKADAGLPIVAKEIASAASVSVDSVERAAAQHRAVEEAEAEWRNNPPIDPQTLSLSAQRKLEIIHRQLQKAASRAVAARMAQIDDEVHRKVMAETAERLQMLEQRQRETLKVQNNYRNLTNEFRPLYTIDEWDILRRVAHPDNSASEALRSQAFALIISMKFKLTGVK